MYNADNEDRNSQSNEGPDLSHIVQENSEKISLVEFWQKEILTQLRLLAEKLWKQVISNDEEEEKSVKDETEPNKVVPSKGVTHKEIVDMLSKALTDDGGT